MEKIAAALQRSLQGDDSEDGLFGPVRQVEALEPGPRPVPGRIRYSRTRSIEVPPAVLERHRIAVTSNGASADAFRLLRTELLMKMRQNDWRTLAVTSPNKGAGKSTISLNLAISFAMEVDHTALLVDADLRDPDLRHMLEIPPGPGLADYLTGKADLEDVLLHPGIGNLVVLPGGTAVGNTAELMRSPMMAELVREVRSRYPERLVVFDVPPALSGADTLALSAYMDATILVIEERRTRRQDIERCMGLLGESNVIGVVLNKSRQLPKPDPIKWDEPGPLERFFGTRG